MVKHNNSGNNMVFHITIPEQNWLHDIIQKPDRKIKEPCSLQK